MCLYIHGKQHDNNPKIDTDIPVNYGFCSIFSFREIPFRSMPVKVFQSFQAQGFMMVPPSPRSIKRVQHHVASRVTCFCPGPNISANKISIETKLVISSKYQEHGQVEMGKIIK